MCAEWRANDLVYELVRNGRAASKRRIMLHLSEIPGVELAMHIHPWLTPPLDDRATSGPRFSYLANHSPDRIWDKLESVYAPSDQGLGIDKRIYLGHDTQLSRLFWLLASPVGRARTLAEVQRAVDRIETARDMDETGEEYQKASQRVRKAISKLRAAIEEGGAADHVLIVRGGSRATRSAHWSSGSASGHDQPSIVSRMGPHDGLQDSTHAVGNHSRNRAQLFASVPFWHRLAR